MVNCSVAVYGITALGRKIQIGTATKTINDANYVGGTIYYINPAGAGGTYTFYDEAGEEIPTENIGVGSKPWAYKVTGTVTTDKYFVFHDSLALNKQWTYQRDGSWVLESIGGTGTSFGTGKNNTAIVMAKDNGAYYLNNINSCWAFLKTSRDEALAGCNDWFIPSKDESEALRLAIEEGRVTSVGIVTYTGKYIWSSSEDRSNHAWCWYSSYWSNDYKYNSNSCVLVRAF